MSAGAERARPKLRLVAGALVLLALLALGYAFARVAERGRFATPYSTYGAGPEGARALLLLAQGLGYKTVPITRELSDLPRGTLVAYGGCRAAAVRKVSRPEREAIARWVEAGGLLIAIGTEALMPRGAGLFFQREAECGAPAGESLLEALLRERGGAGEDETSAELAAEAAGPPLSYLLPFNVRDARTLRVGHDAEATEILTSADGTLGLTAPYGRGRVVLLGISEALTNESLSDGGGLVFGRLLRAFAPAGPVFFDEYHLGMGERLSLIGYLRELGYAPLLLQALAAVLVSMLAFSLRIAPVAEAADAPLRIRHGFFDALGALFRESGDTRAALALLADAALKRIAHSYHAQGVPGHKLERWLKLRGLFAVAHYARNIARHAQSPLAPHEDLTSRARAIDQDATLAIAIAITNFGSRAEPRASTGPGAPDE